VVLEGEGAINNIKMGSGLRPVVQVRDETDQPVAGAKVTFSLPDPGPGGSFFGAGRSVSVTTDEQGRAVGFAFRPNLIEGRFRIEVTAAQSDRVGTANITQNNVVLGEQADPVFRPDRRFGRGKLIAILAAGATVAGAVAARGGDDESAAAVPGTSITPGTVLVGTPR
jgi:hypothetical protein